jgi:hypothetical protein
MSLPSDTSVKVKFEAFALPELCIYVKRENVGLSQPASEVLLCLERHTCIYVTDYLQ